MKDFIAPKGDTAFFEPNPKGAFGVRQNKNELWQVLHQYELYLAKEGKLNEPFNMFKFMDWMRYN